ncbi:MAG: twin-arginine translocase subunit TatC [Dysgonamonadaceae bacterium]|nr:twin-arginine translocase subunit TatC [Dysgonamonadaceae bacterium]
MENQNLSFWEHLEDLRWTILRAAIALVIFTIAGLIFMPYFFDSIVLAPCYSDFFLYRWLCKISSHTSILPDFCNQDFQVHIINIRLASQLLIHLSASFWLALVLTFPYLVFEIWRFIKPALYEHEKKNVRWVFMFGTVMFFIGCLVGYFTVFPITLRFLATYELSPTIVNQISLDSYMDTFIMLIFVMGLVFELPLLSWFLSKLGLLKRSFFNKYRRHAIVANLIVAALITPSGDPFTLMVVFLPLYVLYEISALFVKPDDKLAKVG